MGLGGGTWLWDLRGLGGGTWLDLVVGLDGAEIMQNALKVFRNESITFDLSALTAIKSRLDARRLFVATGRFFKINWKADGRGWKK